MSRSFQSILAILIFGFFASLSRSQTAAPATQPAVDYNAGPADVSAPKLNNRGMPDTSFMRLHQTFLDRGKSGPIGILFLGDSITQFWTRASDVFKAHYDAYQAANFGISGDKTQHVLWRIDSGELDGIHPKLVILLIGTNNFRDSEDDIYRGDKKIIDEIHSKLPDSKLLILGIFPRGHDPHDVNALLDSRYPTGPTIPVGRAKLAAVNVRLAKLADGVNTRFLDLTDKFVDANGVLDKSIMADYLHPTHKGYEIWADAMQPVIESMIGPPPSTLPSAH